MAQRLMPAPAVVYAAGERSSGMARMLGELVADNVRDYPSRARVAARLKGDVALRASDRDLAITLCFRGDRVVVRDGIVNGAPVLSGPWLEMAKVCSGRRSPLDALRSRDLTVSLRGHPLLVAGAGHVLSVPASHYEGEDPKRKALVAAAVAGGLVAAVVMWRARRRSARRRRA